MDLLLVCYFFIIGLVFGSFFNVVGLRVPKSLSIVTPRSHCPNCKRTLRAYELIPFFSYLVLKGKCKGCRAKISFIYPVIELVTGVLFAYSYYHFGMTAELVVALIFLSMLLIIFVSDLAYMLIPNSILLAFAPVLLILRLVFAPLEPWWDLFLGAVVGFSLLYLIALVSRGGMGGGDVKLFAVLGLVLGFKGVLLAFFLSTVIGSIVGIVGLLIGKVKRGEPMPFGPSIVIASTLTYFFGHHLVHWYLQLF